MIIPPSAGDLAEADAKRRLHEAEIAKLLQDPLIQRQQLMLQQHQQATADRSQQVQERHLSAEEKNWADMFGLRKQEYSDSRGDVAFQHQLATDQLGLQKTQADATTKHLGAEEQNWANMFGLNKAQAYEHMREYNLTRQDTAAQHDAALKEDMAKTFLHNYYGSSVMGVDPETSSKLAFASGLPAYGEVLKNTSNPMTMRPDDPRRAAVAKALGLPGYDTVTNKTGSVMTAKTPFANFPGSPTYDPNKPSAPSVWDYMAKMYDFSPLLKKKQEPTPAGAPF